VLCATEGADKITATIAEAARTNKIGDGQIWVMAIDRAVRIRTSEIGDDASSARTSTHCETRSSPALVAGTSAPSRRSHSQRRVRTF
jgi:hypothetical protein